MESTERNDFSNQHGHPSVPTLIVEPPATETISPRQSLRPTQPAISRNDFSGLTPSLSTSDSLRSRASSIRLRRQPSAQQLHHQYNAPGGLDGAADTEGRRRSFSEPQRPPWAASTDQGLARQDTFSSQMPEISEDHAEHHTDADGRTASEVLDSESQKQLGHHSRLRAATTATANAPRGFLRRLSSSRLSTSPEPPRSRHNMEEEYGSDAVDLLDVVDPEVSTLSTLTNVQNSLFIPDLGRFLNRRPTYDLSPYVTSGTPPPGEKAGGRSTAPSSISTRTEPVEPKPPVPPKSPVKPKQPRDLELETDSEPKLLTPEIEPQQRLGRTMSISSSMSESRYAVLPHGVTLVGWSDEDKELLNDHVRHMLHSKRSAFKRGMKGFGKYVRKRKFWG